MSDRYDTRDADGLDPEQSAMQVRVGQLKARADRVQTRAERTLQIPWIAHGKRAVDRYNGRFGYGFGAGVAYFSVLAVVPIMMVSFSVLGFFLVELQPDLIDRVSKLAVSQLRHASPEDVAKLETIIGNTLQNYTAIGLIGLATGLYTSAAWMGHLRNAIDAQWRSDFDAQRETTFYPIKVALNLLRMAGLLIAIGVTFGLATISTNLAQQIAAWLGLSDTWLTSALLRVLAPVLSLVAGWLTFCYIYRVVPRRREDRRYIMLGSLIGAFGLGIMQYGASLLLKQFSGNLAAVIFGPVIVLMLFFNLFAQLILIVAAWIATAKVAEAFPDTAEKVIRFPIRPAGAVPAPAAQAQVQTTARAVRTGLIAGWVFGAASGLGLGALAAGLAALLGRRRRSTPPAKGRAFSGRRPPR